MLDRRHQFFFGEDVDQITLNRLQDAAEASDGRVLELASLGAYPTSGLAPTADGVSLVLSVSAGKGVALHADPNGSGSFPIPVRLDVGATINLASLVPGASTIAVLVALKWNPVASGPDYDEANVAVMTYLGEGYSLVAIAGTAGYTYAAIPADCCPICDVSLTGGQTVIKTTDLDLSRARPAFTKQGSPGGALGLLSDLAASKLDNCRGYVLEPPSLAANLMKVGVRPGRINVAGASVTVAGGTVTLTAATATKRKTALVYVDSAGALQVAYSAEVLFSLGSPAPTPSFEGRFPVASYDVLDSTTMLTPASLVDVRPMMGMARDVPNRYKFTAAGGETAVTIVGFTFIPGAHSLQVYKQGLLLAESAYTEAADGTGITGLAALGAGNVVELVAPRIAGANPTLAHAPAHAADGSDPLDYSTIGGLVCPGFELWTTGNNAATVGPFAAVVSGVLRKVATSSVIDALLAAPAASTWLYLYCFWNGSMQFELSTTAPSTDRKVKSGDATRTYLGALYSTSSSVFRAFRRFNRKTTYLSDSSKSAIDGTAANNIIASHTGTGAGVLISAAALFPPHCLLGELQVDMTAGAVGNSAVVAGQGAQVNSTKFWQLATAGNPPGRCAVDFDGSTRFQITATAALVVVTRGASFED